jgi:hypothetical protein
MGRNTHDVREGDGGEGVGRGTGEGVVVGEEVDEVDEGEDVEDVVVDEVGTRGLKAVLIVAATYPTVSHFLITFYYKLLPITSYSYIFSILSTQTTGTFQPCAT